MGVPSVEAEADSIGAIEHRLCDIIRGSAEPSDAGAVVRARTLNLIVRGDSREQRDHAADILASLAETQPSRAIILSSRDEVDKASHIEARLKTNCRKLNDKQLCYEQISIETYGEAGRHVAGIVEPLLVSHLPSCLWWVGDPDFTSDVFRQLASVSDRVIVDSQCFMDVVGDITALAALIGNRALLVDDLNWQRVTPWREIIAQLFGGPEGINLLHTISSVTVRTSGNHPVQALLLLGWLGGRLGWRFEDGEVMGPAAGGGTGRSIDLRIEHGHEVNGDVTETLVTTAAEKGDGHFEVRRIGDNMITAIHGAGTSEVDRTSALSWPSEPELLQSCLALRCRDTVFEEAVAAARELLSHDVNRMSRP